MRKFLYPFFSGHQLIDQTTVGAFLQYFFMPETKGLALEEITAKFEGRKAEQMTMADRVHEKDTHQHVERRESGDDIKEEV